MAVNAGTAYVRIIGDLSDLRGQLVTTLSATKLGRLAKPAGVAIGAGLAAGVAGKGLFNLGEQFDDAFDRIRVNTGRTGRQLKGLQGDFKDVLKDVPVGFDQASTAVAGLNQRLGLTGRPLQRLSRQILNLSRITGTDVQENVESVTRLFGDWSIATEDQAGQLDRLFRVSQRTGIGVSDLSRLLVQFGAPLRALGFDIDTAAATFGRFEKEGVNLSTLLPGLRFGLKNIVTPTGGAADALGQLGIKTREPAKAFPQILEALSNMKDETRVTALAAEIFGKRAGVDMGRAIVEGRFEVDKMVESIRSGGDTINQAAKDTDDFSEAWQRLKNNVFVAIEPVATRFFNAISDGMEAISTGDIDLGGLDLGPLQRDISSATQSIRSILESDLVQFIGSNIVGGVRRGLQGVVQAFRGAFQTIAALLRAFDDLLHLRFADAFGELDDIARGSLRTVLGVLRAQTAPLREVASRASGGVRDAFRSAFRSLRSIVGDGLDLAGRAMRARVDFFRGIGDRLGDAVVGGLRVALRAVSGVVSGAFRRGGAFIGNIGDAIRDWLNDNTPFGDKIDVGPIDIRIPKLAKGAKDFRGGLAVVGEQGPEIVHLPQGSDVVSHPQSKRLVKQTGLPLPGFAKGTVTPAEVTAIAKKWGVNRAVASIGAAVEDRFPAMDIISGFRAGSITPNGSRSNHAIRAALDLGARGALNRAIGRWVRSEFPKTLRRVTEDVLDVDNDPTPPDHADHVHVAALGSKAIAKVMRGARDSERKIRIPRKLTLGQIVTIAKRVGFPDPALAAAVAYAESRGNVGAAGDSGESLGLWQIHTPSHPRYDEDKLTDAFYNARAALAISNRGTNWKPWTQFRNAAYKQFLGGRATPLPKGAGGSAGSGSSYADLIALRLAEAEDTPGMKDDVRWINRGLRYWRGVYRRNKRAGNFARANDALSQIKDLRQRKKDLREKPEEEVFTLGGLSKIGRWNIAGLQGTLDQISLNQAKAALTEYLDAEGNVLPHSYEDDLKAAQHLVTIWNDLYSLASGAIPGVKGTRLQQTEAAQNLKQAQDALRSIQQDMKSEVGSVTDTDVGRSVQQEHQAFLSGLGDLRKLLPNFRPLQSLEGGGVVEGPVGKPRIIQAHGQEWVFDPRTGDLSVVVKNPDQGKSVQVVNNFREQPKDPHTWARTQLFELEAAI